MQTYPAWNRGPKLSWDQPGHNEVQASYRRADTSVQWPKREKAYSYLHRAKAAQGNL